MKRPALLVVTVLASLVGSLAAAEPLAGSRPNVVLVMTDDQGYAPVARHGHAWLRTPHLDEMYDRSVRFDRFLVSPTCSPTRSAIMTGRHPMRNGVTHTIFERERLTLDATTLPQVLATAGYTSGIFGKWHLGDEDPYQPHNRGFDEAFIHGAGGIGQAYDCSCADAPGNGYFDPVLRHNGSYVKTDGFCTDLFFHAALGWIKEVKDSDQPFFAYIATNAPHSPYIAPPKNTQRFEALGFEEKTAGFYGMIENIDENFGRLISKLEEWKLMDNTLVIFMSDNGMAGGGSGPADQPLGHWEDGTPLLRYNAGMKGLKNSTDEGGVRVPFFVRWDGRITPGREVETVTAHIDILPTLASLAGAEVPQGQVEGLSLLPLIEEANPQWPERYLFTHIGRWPTGEDPNKSQWKNFAVRNQRFRLIGSDALYDMVLDPSQTRDVAREHPEVVDAMRAAYDAWWKQTVPMMVNESAPLSETRPFHVEYAEQESSQGIPEWEPPEL